MTPLKCIDFQLLVLHFGFGSWPDIMPVEKVSQNIYIYVYVICMTFSVECRPLSCSKLQVHVSGPGGTCQVELGRLLVVVSLCVRLWPFHGRLSLWLPLFVALVFEFSGVLFYTRLHPLLGRHPGQLPSPPWVGERGTHSGGYGPRKPFAPDHGPNSDGGTWLAAGNDSPPIGPWPVSNGRPWLPLK